jgi:hypothetical protein
MDIFQATGSETKIKPVVHVADFGRRDLKNEVIYAIIGKALCANKDKEDYDEKARA